METETNTGSRYVLQDALTVPNGVVLADAWTGRKPHGMLVLSRAELQEIVQQAHDRYGVVADPFATPGSGSVEFPPEFDGFPGTYGWERESDDLLDALERAHNAGVRW